MKKPNLLNLRAFVLPMFAAVVVPEFVLVNPLDFTLTDGEKSFQLSQAAGKYVALHFLLAADDPIGLMYVSEYAKQAPRVAGVVHVFIKAADESAVDAFQQKSREKMPNVTIFRDAEAGLAKQFAVPDGFEFNGTKMHAPALILLDQKGQEIFRHVAKDERDLLPFIEFRFKMSELTKNPNLTQYNVKDQEPAIAGYDPVSYIESSKAEKGSKEYLSTYRSVMYYFATEKHRDAFAENPEKYVPAYGGWCATAMSDGKKVEIDPTNFKVTNSRLFLFNKGFFGNAINDWNKNELTLTKQADAAWERLAPGDLERAGK